MRIRYGLPAVLVALVWIAGCITSGPERDYPTRFTNSIGMEFVLVRPDELTVRDRRTGRVRTVTVDTPFYLGIHEVTQEQWVRVMGNNPSKFQDGDRPVEMVSWYDCVAFCEKLSVLDGRRYRLPTAMEWEHACRAGSRDAFCFGDDEKKLGEYAWYGANSGDGIDNKGHAVNGSTHLVKQKKPNAWGLFDMHGNVMEWCQDKGIPSEQAIVHRQGLHDERGTPIPDSWRLMGGGCYAFPAFMSWCDGRWQPYPDLDRSFILGFRVVLDQLK